MTVESFGKGEYTHTFPYDNSLPPPNPLFSDAKTEVYVQDLSSIFFAFLLSVFILWLHTCLSTGPAGAESQTLEKRTPLSWLQAALHAFWSKTPSPVHPTVPKIASHFKKIRVMTFHWKWLAQFGVATFVPISRELVSKIWPWRRPRGETEVTGRQKDQWNTLAPQDNCRRCLQSGRKLSIGIKTWTFPSLYSKNVTVRGNLWTENNEEWLDFTEQEASA